MPELKRLRDELNVDKPSRREFQIPTIPAGKLLLEALSHLPRIIAHIMSGGRRGDGTLDDFLDSCAQRRRTEHDPRAGQRHALPCPGFFRVIVRERFQADSSWAL